MNEPHNSRTKGDSASKSRSVQRKYTVTGWEEHIKSCAVKSVPAKQRTTFSVKSGRMRAANVPQAESKKRSLKLACVKLTSRNWVASSGDSALSLIAAVTTPARILCRTYGNGATPSSRAANNRSEEHTSELQSRQYLVCRLLLEKKKKNV